MTNLKIYINSDNPLLNISLDEFHDRHLSVGKSQFCDISLAKFADQLTGVEDTHFVIFKENNDYLFITPQKDNPPRDDSGEPLREGSIPLGKRLSFGNCQFVIESETKLSPYLISVLKDGVLLMSKNLPFGEHTFGDQASNPDIILPFDTSGKKIFYLNIAEDGILLFSKDDALTTGMGTILSPKTMIDFSEQYSFGAFNISFSREDALDKNLPQINVGGILLNLILFALFAVAILLLLDIFVFSNSSHATVKSDSEMESPEATKKRLDKLLDSGAIFDAMHLLSINGDALKSESARVTVASSAFETIYFHRRLVAIHEKNLGRKEFFKLLESQNPSLSLNCSIKYLEMATKEILEARKLLEPIENAQTTSQHSYLKTESAQLLKKIDTIADYYRNFTTLNNAWTNGNWDDAVKILDTLSEKIIASDMKELLSLCENKLNEARTGQKIKLLKKQMAEQKLSTENLKDMRMELSMINTSIEKMTDFDAHVGELLRSEYLEASTNLETAQKILSAFYSWKEDLANEKTMLALVETINLTPHKQILAIKSTVATISDEISQIVKKRISSLDETPSLENLNGYDKFSQICDMISFFDPNFDSSSLYAKRKKINQELLKKCDSLYSEYLIRKANSDPSAKNILDEIISNAPASSRYEAWAKQEKQKGNQKQ